ncbi:MAG: hypothetical protein QXD03_03160 [Candidatus Anstonellales archaeon]
MNTIKLCLYAKNGICEKFNIKISEECNSCIFRTIDERLKEIEGLDFIQEKGDEESEEKG